MTRITSTLCEAQYTFVTLSCSVLLIFRNVSDISLVKTCILCSVTFFFFLNCAIYKIMWKNIVQLDKPHMTIWHMCIVCWIPKDTNTQNI